MTTTDLTTTQPAPAGDTSPVPHIEQQTMRAITQDRYGSADVLGLEIVDRPTVGPDEVLIDVHAAGVDRGTCHLMTGTPYLIRLAGYGFTRPKNKVPGLDVAGRVVAVGDRVSRFAIGDEVFGIARGSLAEYATAHQDKLAHRPANATLEHVAVAAVSGIAALQALTDVGNVQRGQRVLIIGASGGVGSFAVQLAKAYGAEVTGVASSRNIELVRSLGADHVVDYTVEDFTATGHRYDLILDTGGRNKLSRLRKALAPTGTLVIVGGEGGNRITGGVGRQLRAMLLSPFVGQRLTTFISTEHYSFIERLADHIEAGDVTPEIGARFSLDDAPRAIDQLDAGRGRGKSVILIDRVAGDEA